MTEPPRRQHTLIAAVVLLAAAAAPGQSDPCFVPNLGQWPHAAHFVQRCAGMTVFVEDRGWVLDLRDGEHDDRAAAVRMTFDGRGPAAPTGEGVLAGVHNYFLGNDPDRWRTGVPRYERVRFERLYPGVDVVLREQAGVPEYDLLLEPGAALAAVAVRVAGSDGLSLRDDGALVVHTPLGPLVQPRPRTWQVDADGQRNPVECAFVLLGPSRFGFAAPEWTRDTRLVIDPGLLWSTFVGGNGTRNSAVAVAVDRRGVTTIAGTTHQGALPTTMGAYSPTFNGGVQDAFVSRLDPSLTGPAQLLFSTFVGGSSNEFITTQGGKPMHVDEDSGVITLAGDTSSADFPTTAGAFARAHSGLSDVFLLRLDPARSGAAQLVYATLLGGSDNESLQGGIALDSGGAIAVAGMTSSADFPTSGGALATSYIGGTDAFVTILDPSTAGSAQLAYSTFVGGSSYERATGVLTDGAVLTVTGTTLSANFPTTPNAYTPTLVGSQDVFVCRIAPRAIGSAQLVYSTYLGGSVDDQPFETAAAANGVIVLVGETNSPDFPTTPGAFNRSRGGGFVCTLDPSRSGTAQLAYCTYFPGTVHAVAVDDAGVFTLGGFAGLGFPTTANAYQSTLAGGVYDAFVSRLDPRLAGSQQLRYSTLLGGTDYDFCWALAVDGSGVATLAGQTSSRGFPTTKGAFDAGHSGGGGSDVFVARLDVGVSFYADVHEIALGTGGTQRFTLNAGAAHAGRAYTVLGSFTGTTPGVTLGAVHVPLNPDAWTSASAALANTPVFVNSLGTLDPNGTAQAAFTLPSLNLPSAVGLVLHHAYLVFDGSGTLHSASNAVPVTLVQ